jgi:bifunctional enzyme CysN/CysC
MNEAGLICVCAFLAPDENVRAKARDVVGSERFFEIYLTAPFEFRRQRDSEGMYAKAEAGDIIDFPGVSAPYDAPKSPDLVLPTDQLSVEVCVDKIVALLDERGVFA